MPSVTVWLILVAEGWPGEEPRILGLWAAKGGFATVAVRSPRMRRAGSQAAVGSCLIFRSIIRGEPLALSH